MPTTKRPRRGSLQFYPRKRAAKVLPSSNFRPLSSTKPGLLGFIGYKVGMATALVKDATPNVLTGKKTVALPVTILEVPNMKIFSVRFYKQGVVSKDIIVSNDKELKRKLKAPKTPKDLAKETPEDFDDVRIIAYSLPRQTSIKKTPDIIELAIQGEDAKAKLDYIKPLIGKELTMENFSFENLVDARGLTRGKGTQGPVKRFGITLRFHKSEKGVRKVGSIGPWHPAHTTFRVPMAGQLGLFSRIIYNLHVLSHGSIKDSNINPNHGFKNYGNIKTSYLILSGSIQGPSKRQILLTPSFRPSKKQNKRKLEFQEVFVK